MKSDAAVDDPEGRPARKPRSGAIVGQRNPRGRVDGQLADLQRVVDDAVRAKAQRRTTLADEVEGVTVHERAKGIVMMRYDLNQARAAEQLDRWARLADVEVRVIAQTVVKAVSFDPDLPDSDTRLARVIAASPGSLLG